MPRRKPEPLDRSALLDYALRTLTRRGMSVSDLRARLARRAAQPADVDPVIAKLKEAGFLNDQRFAESYAASRLENQGFGRIRVLHELRRRRVAPQVAGSAVEQTFQGTDEYQLAEQYIARKYRGKDLASHFSEPKNVVSAFRRLRHAGFSAGAAAGVLRRYAAGADELADGEEASEAEE